MLKQIIEKYQDQEFLKADGFDEAIIGVEEINMKLIYSVSKCLKIIEKDTDKSTLDFSKEEAMEYFMFNVHGAYVGEKTPVWCWDTF